MAFCPNCGAQLLEGARFCQNCGTQVAQLTSSSSVYSTIQPPVYSSYDTSRNDYRLIMVKRGTCTKANARELLMDIFGYTAVESNAILDSLPAEIACSLTFQQAVYAAQALTEYGIDVSVVNSDGYTDINRYADSSVYNSNGSFLSNVLSVLGTLTVANRIRSLSRWDRPLVYTFRPTYKRTAPPAHIRHNVRKLAPAAPKPPRTPAPRRDAPLRNAVAPKDPPRSQGRKTSNSSNNTAVNRAPHSNPRGGNKGGGPGSIGGRR